jgi:hypothetical protein
MKAQDPKNIYAPLPGKHSPNLDQGHPMAKAKNSPGPLPKHKTPNLDQGHTMAKPKNSPGPMAKTKRVNLDVGKPAASSMTEHDERIRRELTTGKRDNSHRRPGG